MKKSPSSPTSKSLTPAQRDDLLKTLKSRFEKNMPRHKGLDWSKVQSRLDASPEKLHSLAEMERTGGEPDVVGLDKKTGEILFVDCSPESPKDRRSLCYDRQALDSRKENKPKNSAVDLATSIGIKLLTEDQYRDLQKLGEFDTKTSSWVDTPFNIRDLGGALFCDRRFDTVFLYHNGAESYYAARGFRGALKGSERFLHLFVRTITGHTVMKNLLIIPLLSLLLPLTACTAPSHEKPALSPSALPPGAQPLFKGTTFAGWKISSPNTFWTFSPDGILTAENDPALHGYDLYTEKSYKDIEFQIEFRYSDNSDSGVYLRKPLIQVQIGVSSSLHSEKTGSLFQEGRGGGYVANATGTDQLLKPGQWNKLRFIAQGDSLKVWLNDTLVLTTSIAKYPDPAPLGLQLHPGVKMKIEFRNGWLKEL